MTIDEITMKAFLNPLLRGKQVMIFSKKWGVDELQKYEGIVISLEPEMFIDYKDKNNEDAHAPFCGNSSGILLIIAPDGRVFYNNEKILEVDKLGYTQSCSLLDDSVRKRIVKAGKYYLYPEEITV
jgi:hypothetical protein